MFNKGFIIKSQKKKLIMKTKLLKELFYIDFLYYKKSCISITGLEYAKLPYGPVPEDFDLLLESCYIIFLIKDNIVKNI